jgi:putative hydrolase of the HAD superfamily
VQFDRIRAVAFDAVGTLIHPEPSAAEVYAAVGKRFGSRLSVREIRTRFSAAFAAQERLDLQNGLATSEERERRRWRDIVAQVLDDVRDPAGCFAELHAHFSRPEAWRCEEGAADCLAWVRRAGGAVALASNYDHRLHRVLAGLTPLAAIQTVVISSEVGWRKPAPTFFDHVAAALGLPPEAVLHLGDDVGDDFEGARRAGMKALLFDPKGRHSALGRDRIGSLSELASRFAFASASER